MNAIHLFSTIEPYGSLSHAARDKIFSTLERREYHPGDLLISDFSSIEHVGLLVSGKADVLTGLTIPHQVVVGTLCPGDFFGELACLSNGKSLVSISCRETSVVYLQTFNDFLTSLTSHEILRIYFLNTAVEKLSHLLQTLISHNSAGVIDNPPGAPIPKRIKKALQFINTHYDHPLTVVQVAQVSGMGKSTFSRYFNHYLGVSFRTYLNQLRIAKAKDFLTRGGMNVTEACFAAGFNDTAHFSRTFHRIEGVSPSQLKQNVWKKTNPVAGCETALKVKF